jgi:hypothetical protein
VVVGGFSVNFKKICLFENFFWRGWKELKDFNRPFSGQIGTFHVTVSSTPQVLVYAALSY